jgi:hypothetical protein
MSHNDRVMRCPVYGYACSTAYGKRGCRCQACTRWKRLRNPEQRGSALSPGQRESQVPSMTNLTPVVLRPLPPPVLDPIQARSATLNRNGPPRSALYIEADPAVLVVELAGCGHRVRLPVDSPIPTELRCRTCRTMRPVLRAGQDTLSRAVGDAQRFRDRRLAGRPALREP